MSCRSIAIKASCMPKGLAGVYLNWHCRNSTSCAKPRFYNIEVQLLARICAHTHTCMIHHDTSTLSMRAKAATQVCKPATLQYRTVQYSSVIHSTQQSTTKRSALCKSAKGTIRYNTTYYDMYTQTDIHACAETC